MPWCMVAAGGELAGNGTPVLCGANGEADEGEATTVNAKAGSTGLGGGALWC